MNKRILVVLALTAALVLSFAGVAQAKYAGHIPGEAYLSWDGANDLYNSINATDTGQLSPHGGYTQTTVKCVVCHSVHRAYSASTESTLGADNSLLNGTGTAACAECHAAWGASPSDTLVAVGETFSGPHIGAGGATCANRGCHGSVHGVGQNTKYAVVSKYNLQNTRIDGSWVETASPGIVVDAATDNGYDQLTAWLDYTISKGNTNSQIGTTATGPAMKAFVTGYVCAPCHSDSSFSVAAAGFANPIELPGATPEEQLRTGHPSAGGQFYGHAPTCEKCHDLVDVASNSTAFPHANRGIDVYNGRFAYAAAGEYDGLNLVQSGTIATDNTNATRYGLWMTASAYDDNVNADPIEYTSELFSSGGGYSLRDGVCMKCHDTSEAAAHPLP